MVRDEVVGVLDCQSDQLNYFDHETIELSTLFLHPGLHRARECTVVLAGAPASQATGSHQYHRAAKHCQFMELEDLLTRVCSVIQHAFQVSQVSLLLREEDDLVMRAFTASSHPASRPAAVFRPQSTPGPKSLNSSGTVIEKDLSNAPESFRLFRESASRMSIPLISFGHTLGVLTLHSSKVNAFRESELQSLESVADICANSIQNAHYVERVKQLAYLDGLTGIFNRRFFELRIMEEVERARRYGAAMAVIMADIDQFKLLNDEFGHLLGDEVLRQVSSIFHQQLRKTDVVCRYGGEEFALLLTQTNAEQAFVVAEKLRKMVEKWQFPGVPRAITISAGVAAFPLHGKNRDELVRAADSGLYLAKQAGRNRVCIINIPGQAAATGM